MQSIAGGHDHTCAIVVGGAVHCWGSNARGQLGRVSVSTIPATAGPISVKLTASAIDVRNSTTCAIDLQRKLWCWGDNSRGQLGISSDTPMRGNADVVPSVPPADAVAVGGRHVCALSSGKVYCWGDNSAGQLGNGKTVTSLAPVPVAGLGEVMQIGAGWHHTCVRNAVREVWCWGLNESRQAGAAQGQIVILPAKVFQGAVEIRCGWEHTCVRMQDRSVHCWGAWHLGQLGDGAITSTALPMKVR